MASINPTAIQTATLTGGPYDYLFENVYDVTVTTKGFGGGVEVTFSSSDGLVNNSGKSSTFDQSKEEKAVVIEEEEMLTRDCVFPRVGGYPVVASTPGYSKIPWAKGTLTLIAQSPDGQLHYAKTLEEKKEFAFSNFIWILVCWPGVYSQDIFIVDDMKAFRKALGFKKKSTTVLVDEDGEEWT